MSCPVSLKTFLARIQRMPRTRGFGVQSPSDYRFITKELRAAVPEEVLQALPSDKALSKFLRLVYLVALSRKPHLCAVLTQRQGVGQIVKKACDSCELCGEEGIESADMIVLSADEACAATADIAKLLDRMKEAILLIEGIHNDEQNHKLWYIAKAHPKSTLSFDLYSAGVIRHDTKRFPEHYRLFF